MKKMNQALKKGLLLALLLVVATSFAALPQAKKGSIAKDAMVGNYVTDAYAKRSKGYDWVAVSISKFNDTKYRISVRSRGDRKKTTCTFDSYAYVADKGTLKAYVNNKPILFVVKGNTLTIKAEQEADANELYFFCSGGASLAGSYMRINGPIDQKQVDKTVYQKFLTWDKISFSVSQTGDMLTINPIGLTIDSSPITLKVDGKAVDAEVGDLNADNYPELFIYTYDKNGKGNAIGFSVNNGKSMSQITFTGIADRKDLQKGFGGNDEFAIVEATFVQRFPIYKDVAKNIKANKTRQIQYKLKNGEASRVLTIDKVLEY